MTTRKRRTYKTKKTISSTINSDAKTENLNFNEKSQKSTSKAINKKSQNSKKSQSKQQQQQHLQPPSVPKTNENVITNYFPVVSKRLLAAKLKEDEIYKEIRHFIETKTDPEKYLTVAEIDGKGKGIMALTNIRKGSFICEYSGDLIDLTEAKTREHKYELSGAGCYMYYFNWNNIIWCVDATKPTGRFGRLINHSRKTPNCKTKVFDHKGTPHLIFVALRDIMPNEEILYDYGERDPIAIKSNPWLTTT